MMRYLFLTLFSLIANISIAQQSFTLESFEEDKLIKSLGNVLYIVRQEYAVRGPDSLLYGDNNREYFGEAYGPALKVGDRLILNKFTYYPYLRDTSFRELGKGYVPEPIKTMVKSVKDSTFAIMEVDSVVTGKNTIQIPAGDSLGIGHGLKTELSNKMDCVLITFYSADSVLTEDSQFDYSFVNTSVSWRKDGKGIIDEEFSEDTLFGFLFYEYTGRGMAALIPAGVVEKYGENSWRALKIDTPLYAPKTESKSSD